MDDLISRKNMLRELSQMYNEERNWYDDAPAFSEIKVRADASMATMAEIRKRVKKMPSAQPEIIRCEDCKYFAGEGMYCAQDIIVQFDHFYCYYAERREE